MTENTELKNQIAKLDEKNLELTKLLKEKGINRYYSSFDLLNCVSSDPMHVMKSIDIGEISNLRQVNR